MRTMHKDVDEGRVFFTIKKKEKKNKTFGATFSFLQRCVVVCCVMLRFIPFFSPFLLFSSSNFLLMHSEVDFFFLSLCHCVIAKKKKEKKLMLSALLTALTCAL